MPHDSNHFWGRRRAERVFHGVGRPSLKTVHVQLSIVQLPHGKYPAAWDGLRRDSTTLISHIAHISININGEVVEVLDATVAKVD